MGWFSRKKTIAERFPADRLAALPTIIGLGAPRAAKDADVDADAFFTSRFFSGYLLAYPSYADDASRQLGAGIRMMLFHTIHGEASGSEIHDRGMRHLMAGDEQTRKGASVGEVDGENFFKALENGDRADGATDALKMALKINVCDVVAQV